MKDKEKKASILQSYAFPIALVLYEVVTYLSNDMYLPGLPALAREFSLDQNVAQYTLLFFFLGAASMQLFLGPLSDRYGRRRVILWGGLVFIFTTFACAVTNTIEIFLLARFLQGCTVCSCVVAGYAAIHELYNTEQAIKIISVMGAVTVLAPAFGPLLGSIVMEVYSWRMTFYILTTLGIISVVSLFKIMPDTLQVKEAISVKSTVRDYYRIICNKAFLAYTIPYCIVFLAIIAWIVESPFIIIDDFQKSTLYFGFAQLIIFGSYILGAYITQRLVEKINADRIIILGLNISALAGMILVATVLFSPKDYLLGLIGCMTLLSFGSVLIYGPSNRLAIEACAEPMGRRMAIFSMATNLSGVCGSLIVALFTTGRSENFSYILIICIVMTYLSFIILNKKDMVEAL